LTIIQKSTRGFSAGAQRVFPRTDMLAPPASSSPRIPSHHQSASNVVHASGSCHIAFFRRLSTWISACSLSAPLSAGAPWLIARTLVPVPSPNPDISGFSTQSWEMTARAGPQNLPTQASYSTRGRQPRSLHRIMRCMQLLLRLVMPNRPFNTSSTTVRHYVNAQSIKPLCSFQAFCYRSCQRYTDDTARNQTS